MSSHALPVRLQLSSLWKKWLKQRGQFLLESVSFAGNQGDVFRDQFKRKVD